MSDTQQQLVYDTAMRMVSELTVLNRIYLDQLNEANARIAELEAQLTVVDPKESSA